MRSSVGRTGKRGNATACRLAGRVDLVEALAVIGKSVYRQLVTDG